MSATLSTITQPPATFSRLFSVSVEWIARYYAERSAIAHLNELEDAALSDIGISRSQIEMAVHGTAGSARG